MITILIIILLLSIKPACNSLRDSNTKKAVTAAQQAAQAEKSRVKFEKEIKRIEAKEEKQNQQRQQAEKDIYYVTTQKILLAPLVTEYREKAKQARQIINNDILLNQAGAVVKDADTKAHQLEYEYYLKKVIALEKQLYNLEKKRTQAEIILNRG